MVNCKQCNKEVPQSEGKRQRDFCNNTCKSAYWYNLNKKGKKKVNIPEQKQQAPPNPNEEILAQIKAIRLEKCPKERDGIYGRKIWQKEQDDKIAELQKLLK